MGSPASPPSTSVQNQTWVPSSKYSAWFLRKNGLDDELIYDQKDHEKRLAEIFPWWNKGRKEEALEGKGKIGLEDLRRLFIERNERETNL